VKPGDRVHCGHLSADFPTEFVDRPRRWLAEQQLEDGCVGLLVSLSEARLIVHGSQGSCARPSLFAQREGEHGDGRARDGRGATPGWLPVTAQYARAGDVPAAHGDRSA
jgi:hypothetical protein